MDILNEILEVVDKKQVKKICKKLIKKCSFKNTTNLIELVDLASWLYACDYREYALAICDIVMNVDFSNNYTIWGVVDSAYCQKARILREKGKIEEAKELIDFVNSKRESQYYNNLMTDFPENMTLEYARNYILTTENRTIPEWVNNNYRLAIMFYEPGGFPISNEIFEMAIELLGNQLRNFK